MVTSIALCTSMGVAALIGSRGIAIGVLLGWQLAATPLLLNISQLGVHPRGHPHVCHHPGLAPSQARAGPAETPPAPLHVSLLAAIARPPCVNPDPPRPPRAAGARPRVSGVETAGSKVGGGDGVVLIGGDVRVPTDDSAPAERRFPPSGAAQESNLPTHGLHALAGFEDGRDLALAGRSAPSDHRVTT